MHRLACLLALACLPLTASADELLADLKARSFDAPVVPFTAQIVREGTTLDVRVDARQPEGQRFQVLSPAPETLPENLAEFVEAADRNARGEIWCDQFLASVPDTATRTSADAGRVIYTFTPVPDADSDAEERKLFAKLVGTLVVDPVNRLVASYQLHLPQSMKPHMLARIDSFSMFVDCTPAGNGNSHFNRFQLSLAGSAMGQSFAQNDQRRILTVETDAGE